MKKYALLFISIAIFSCSEGKNPEITTNQEDLSKRLDAKIYKNKKNCSDGSGKLKITNYDWKLTIAKQA